MNRASRKNLNRMCLLQLRIFIFSPYKGNKLFLTILNSASNYQALELKKNSNKNLTVPYFDAH